VYACAMFAPLEREREVTCVSKVGETGGVCY
jgi:hypothetical protein